MSTTVYVYTDRDGVGVQDPATRAYGSVYVGQECVRSFVDRGPGIGLVAPWHRGKALVRFKDGTRVVVRTRLLRKVRVVDARL